MSSQTESGLSGRVYPKSRDASDWVRQLKDKRLFLQYQNNQFDTNPYWDRYGNDFRLMFNEGAAYSFTNSVPFPPTFVSCTPGDEQLTIYFKMYTGGYDVITDIYYSTDDGTTWRSTGLKKTGVFVIQALSTNGSSPLVNETEYNVRFVAVTANFPYPASNIPWPNRRLQPGNQPVRPAQPVITTHEAGDQLLVIYYDLNDNGGSEVTNVRYSTDDGATWRASGQTSSPITITKTSEGDDLVNGLPYFVKIVMVTSSFTDYLNNPMSGTVPMSPLSIPIPCNPPVIGQWVPGDGQLTVPFTLGGSNGSPYLALYYSTDDGATWVDANTLTSPLIITNQTVDGNPGLANGDTYNVVLLSTTDAFPDDPNLNPTLNTPSTPEPMQPGVNPTGPQAPTIESIIVGDEQLTVNFRLGSPGTDSYSSVYYSTDSGATWADMGTTISPYIITTESSDGVTTLNNGDTYFIQIVAVTSPGFEDPTLNTPSSPVQDAMPSNSPVPPGQITNVTSVSGDQTLTVGFQLGQIGSGTPEDLYYSTDGGVTWASTGIWVPGNNLVITTESDTGDPLVNGGKDSVPYQVQLVLTTYPGFTDPYSADLTPSSSVGMTPNIGTIPPAQPTITASSTGDANVSVSFNLGNSGSGSFANLYYSTNDGTDWVRAEDWTIGVNTITITTQSSPPYDDLVNNDPYSVRIVADTSDFGFVSNFGDLTPSDPEPLTPSATSTPPAQPIIIYYTPGDQTLTVYYIPGNDGGSQLVDMLYSTNNGADWASTGTAWSPASNSLLITGLSSDTEVQLTNDEIYPVLIIPVTVDFPLEENTPSALVNMVPMAPPAVAPDQPVITNWSPGNEQLTVFFTLGSNGGSDFTDVYYSTDDGSTWLSGNWVSGTNSIVITKKSNAPGDNVVNTDEYLVKIVAVTVDFPDYLTNTPSGTENMIPNTTTGPPGVVNFNGYDQGPLRVTLNIRFNGDGGSPITDVLYTTDGGASWSSTETWSPGSTTMIVTKESDGITDLVAGPYTLQVMAVTVDFPYPPNVNPISETLNFIVLPEEPGPPSRPAAPNITTNQPGDQQITLYFNTTGGNGGSTIYDIAYSTDDGDTWQLSGQTTSPLIITTESSDGTTLLTNGDEYLVTIQAVTLEYGPDPFDYLNPYPDSVHITPNATSVEPDAPTITNWSPGDKELTVFFDKNGNGGSSFTDVAFSTDGGSTWLLAGSNDSPIIINSLSSNSATPLVNGTSYNVRLMNITVDYEETTNPQSTTIPMTPNLFVAGLTINGFDSISTDPAPDLTDDPPYYGATADNTKVGLFAIPEGGNTFLPNTTPASPAAYEYVSFRMTGYFRAPLDGEYEFEFESDDGLQVKFNGNVILNNSGWSTTGSGTTSAVTLTAGRYYPLEILYANGSTSYKLLVTSITVDSTDIKDAYPFLDQCFNVALTTSLASIATTTDQGITYLMQANQSVPLNYGLVIPSGVELRTNGNILTIVGTLTIDGTLTVDDEGTVSNDVGTVQNNASGVIAINTSSTFDNINGADFRNNGTIFNEGTLTTDADSTFYTDGIIYNCLGGTIENNDTPNQNGALYNADDEGECGEGFLTGTNAMVATGTNCPPIL
jgi:hypothetical protein